jgi:hypothetical protein
VELGECGVEVAPPVGDVEPEVGVEPGDVVDWLALDVEVALLPVVVPTVVVEQALANNPRKTRIAMKWQRGRSRRRRMLGCIGLLAFSTVLACRCIRQKTAPPGNLFAFTVHLAGVGHSDVTSSPAG